VVVHLFSLRAQSTVIADLLLKNSIFLPSRASLCALDQENSQGVT
jgi:hypothetical protein